MTRNADDNIQKIKVKRAAFAIRDYICIDYVKFGMP